MKQLEYQTMMFDRKDLMTLETVLGEKKAWLRDYNTESEFFQRISRILDDVRDRLGWND